MSDEPLDETTQALGFDRADRLSDGPTRRLPANVARPAADPVSRAAEKPAAADAVDGSVGDAVDGSGDRLVGRPDRELPTAGRRPPSRMMPGARPVVSPAASKIDSAGPGVSLSGESGEVPGRVTAAGRGAAEGTEGAKELDAAEGVDAAGRGSDAESIYDGDLATLADGDAADDDSVSAAQLSDAESVRDSGGDGAETVSDEPVGPADGGAGAGIGGEQSSGEGTGGGGDTSGVHVTSVWKKLSASTSGPLIWVLLALFGFTLVTQLRSNNDDQGLAGVRQEDLVRILSDLDNRDSRLQTEISALEDTQRQLTSGVAGRQAALTEAEQRANELGLLAGTLPGRGPGLRIVMTKVKAPAVLNCVEELRGSGGEVMQIAGQDGTTVRIVASSYFVDADAGGIVVDGTRLSGPFTIAVIGLPQNMQPALQIPGGVVASVTSAGGSVTMETRTDVEVTAVRKSTTMQYARPVS